MTIRHAIRKVGAKPVGLSSATLMSEKQLEDTIVAAPEILHDQWMLIGWQVETSWRILREALVRCGGRGAGRTQSWAQDLRCREVLFWESANSKADTRHVVLCQYYAYVEIIDERERDIFGTTKNGTSLWRAYSSVTENWPNFQMTRIAKAADIYPVFRQLFTRQAMEEGLRIRQ
jgi:hypothetical protein